MRRFGLLILIVAGCVAGCKTEPAGTDYYTQGHPYQKYDYKHVKRLVKDLEPGMPRHEVLLRLGSPAEIRGQTWVYLPENPGFVIPQNLLEVRFDRGRYVGHAFKPIVFGLRPAE